MIPASILWYLVLVQRQLAVYSTDLQSYFFICNSCYWSSMKLTSSKHG